MPSGRPFKKRVEKSLDRDIETIARLRKSLLMYNYSNCEAATEAIRYADMLVHSLLTLKAA